jgi:hypothetical protein
MGWSVVGARGFWTFFAAIAVAALVAVTAAARGSDAETGFQTAGVAGLGALGGDGRDTAAVILSAPTTSTTTTTLPPTTTTTLPPTTTTTVFAPTDARLTIFGDSVILGTQYVLPGALAGWDVTLEAKVSRFTQQLIPVVAQARPGLGQAAVIQIGNNYNGDQAAYAADLDRILVDLDGLGRVVLVTVAEFRPDRTQVNDEVRGAATRHPNVVVVDWQGAIAAGKGGPALTARDGLHLTKAGAETMLGLLSQALGPPPAAP